MDGWMDDAASCVCVACGLWAWHGRTVPRSKNHQAPGRGGPCRRVQPASRSPSRDPQPEQPEASSEQSGIGQVNPKPGNPKLTSLTVVLAPVILCWHPSKGQRFIKAESSTNIHGETPRYEDVMVAEII